MSNYRIYILFGDSIDKAFKTKYQIAAYKYIEKLKQYEKAPDELTELLEQDIETFIDNEDLIEEEELKDIIWEFISLFPSRSSNKLFSINSNWDNWYKYQPKEKIVSNSPIISNDIERKVLYMYPNKQQVKIFDIEDLDINEIYVLLYENKEEKKIFIWEDEENETDISEYLNSIESFFSNKDDITILKEKPFDESEDFLKLL